MAELFEKRLVAAPKVCALAVPRVYKADESALGADQTTFKAIDFVLRNRRSAAYTGDQGIRGSKPPLNIFR